ncbi:hypothetical protein [Nocardia carnea]|uniref:hypothetical protein n=1 Tax=Nocardia carnea TaxID=37328 RepID=UPI0002EF1171|nr:hypothetical protein [Nocardia carnea]
MPTHNLTPDIAARVLAAHRPELDLLTQMDARPRIVETGGGCHAIEFDAAPSRTLYLLLTTQDHYLATERAGIEFWCLGLYDASQDHAWKCCAEEPTFAEAYRAVWRDYLTGWHIE